jgi:primase-polymerase (primpol)-like protein
VTAPAADVATRFAAVPPELTACPQWVVWRREARDGKPTKVPYCATAPRRRASSTDAATWAPFAAALSALERDPSLDGWAWWSRGRSA